MTLSIKDVAARYGVTLRTVAIWIRTGELRALQMGRTITSKKPRWRIREADLEAFEITRMHMSPAPKTPRRKDTAQMEWIK
jgi:excisionase family DNA binding protein